MRVYKFRDSHWGLKAINECKLKITCVDSTNDPWELLPFDRSNRKINDWMNRSRADLNSKYGLLCFSRFWHSPVLWAHYADDHKGLCLAFDVSDDLAKPVDYLEKAKSIPFKAPDIEIAKTMMYAKYQHWSYEEEIRAWLTLEDKTGGHYFASFGESLQLAEIIIGAKSPVSVRTIRKALGSNQQQISIRKARFALNEFRVEADDSFDPTKDTSQLADNSNLL